MKGGMMQQLFHNELVESDAPNYESIYDDIKIEEQRPVAGAALRLLRKDRRNEGNYRTCDLLQNADGKRRT